MAPGSFNLAYKVSAPGSLMLFGEHAVLNGKQAIVAAIDKRLTVELVPVKSTQITISDTRLGTVVQDKNELHIQDSFKYAIAAIMLFKDQLPSGFDLHINSEFSSVIGFGSSAAVTVATIAALSWWLSHDDTVISKEAVFSLSLQVIQNIQGAGSGADLAASIYGGVLGYAMQHLHRHLAGMTLPITAIYSGYKTPTSEVIKIIKSAQAQNPAKFANIFEQMHTCTEQAIHSIEQADWIALGKLFNQHHILQAELGTSNELLDSIADKLSAQPEIYGAKISGAGLGDCVIGLGDLPRKLFAANDSMMQFTLNIDPQGLIYAIH